MGTVKGAVVVAAWANGSSSFELSRLGLNGLPLLSVISYQYLYRPRSMLIEMAHAPAQVDSDPRSGKPASDSQTLILPLPGLGNFTVRDAPTEPEFVTANVVAPASSTSTVPSVYANAEATRNGTTAAVNLTIRPLCFTPVGRILCFIFSSATVTRSVPRLPCPLHLVLNIGFPKTKSLPISEGSVKFLEQLLS